MSSKFVIIDTSGLNADFTNQVYLTYHKNQYLIVPIIFDLPRKISVFRMKKVGQMEISN